MALDIRGLTDWVRARIDGENIRTLVRLKRFGYDSARAMPFLHEGGTIDLNLLASIIAEPFESWSRALEFSDYGRVLSQVEAGDDFSQLILALEKVLDDYYLEKLLVYRYSSDAPENVPYFLWSKEMEIKNVRMILVSKGNKGDTESLRGLLRHVCN